MGIWIFREVRDTPLRSIGIINNFVTSCVQIIDLLEYASISLIRITSFDRSVSCLAAWLRRVSVDMWVCRRRISEIFGDIT